MSMFDTADETELVRHHDTVRLETVQRSVFIGPRAVSLVWLVAVAVIIAINPATAEPVQPVLALTILGNMAAFAFYATVIAGLVRFRATDRVGVATGALMLAGHMVCGLDGHLPMTGAVWIGQLGLVAAATAVSGLAVVTRR